jgi:competence protein ComEC
MKKVILFLSVLLIILSISYADDSGELTVYFLNVGQGDASIIVFPNGKVMQIDAGMGGGRYSRDRGSIVLVPFYKDLQIDHIDVAVGSHPDMDHIGGFLTLMKTFTVGEFWDCMQHTTMAYRNMINLIQENEIDYYINFKNIDDRVKELSEQHYFGENVKISKLGPVRDYYENNANSIVLKIEYKKVSFLFGGDKTSQSQSDIARKWKEKLKSTVMLVPHHGSHHNYHPHYLNYVSPEVAIVSVGENNKYGHPSDVVMLAYKLSGARLFRTDSLQSHIKITTNGDSYDIGRIKAKF